jgi:glycosyltransferase involved in cell wall biosynthesis
MRIALVAHTFAHWTAPYAHELMRRGHDVRVLSISADPLDGVPVDYLARDTPTSLKILAHLRTVPRARRSLRRFSPDVVFAPYLSSNGMVAALAWDGPLVVSGRGGDVLPQLGRVPGGRRLHRRMMRLVTRRAGAVHAVSVEIADELAASGAPRERIVCFPIGVDVDVFSPAPAAHRSPLRIICTRRHEPVYANDTLVAALAHLRREGLAFHATFVGGGPQLEERRAQAASLDLADVVEFTGQLSRPDVRDLLRSADIYVSASTTDGTSSSLLEAMACSVFPVVTAIPANRSWIADGETGLLFEPGDAASLARALGRALADHDLRLSAGGANRARVLRDGNFSANMDRLEELLRTVAGAARVDSATDQPM